MDQPALHSQLGNTVFCQSHFKSRGRYVSRYKADRAGLHAFEYMCPSDYLLLNMHPTFESTFLLCSNLAI